MKICLMLMRSFTAKLSNRFLHRGAGGISIISHEVRTA
jgi:hypothetical protein